MNPVTALLIIFLLSMLICWAVAKYRHSKTVFWVIVASIIGPLAIPLVIFSKPQSYR